MDKDLDALSAKELLVEAKKLRQAIRAHRDSELHDLCWYHPELWNLLPETKEVNPQVPNREQFLKGCQIYRDSLDKDFPPESHSEVDFKK
jgi:hypothetical protein